MSARWVSWDELAEGWKAGRFVPVSQPREVEAAVAPFIQELLDRRTRDAIERVLAGLSVPLVIAQEPHQPAHLVILEDRKGAAC